MQTSDYRLWNIPNERTPLFWNATPQIKHPSDTTSPQALRSVSRHAHDSQHGEDKLPRHLPTSKEPDKPRISSSVQGTQCTSSKARSLKFEFSLTNLVFVILLFLVIGFIIYSIVFMISNIEQSRLQMRRALERSNHVYDELNQLQNNVRVAITAYENFVR